MSMPFFSHRLFQDKKNFPYGLSRSGMFTKKQTALLERYGQAYSHLATGLRSPEGPEEIAFVAFCQGLKEAESEHEKVWQLYQRNIGKKVAYFSMDAGRHKTQPDYTEEDYDDLSIA